MLIPTEQLSDIKKMLAELGVKWSNQIDPNPVQPICKGFFQGHLVAIYQEETKSAISEVRCLDGYSDSFEELLRSFMTPVEDKEEGLAD